VEVTLESLGRLAFRILKEFLTMEGGEIKKIEGRGEFN
jgi:hypothetical protein